MSEAGTKIMGTGLVMEGIEYERMEAEIAELKKKLESKQPVCPICKDTMKPFNFKGYYDEISAWGCSCDYFDEGEDQCGAYA